MVGGGECRHSTTLLTLPDHCVERSLSCQPLATGSTRIRAGRLANRFSTASSLAGEHNPKVLDPPHYAYWAIYTRVVEFNMTPCQNAMLSTLEAARSIWFRLSANGVC